MLENCCKISSCGTFILFCFVPPHSAKIVGETTNQNYKWTRVFHFYAFVLYKVAQRNCFQYQMRFGSCSFNFVKVKYLKKRRNELLSGQNSKVITDGAHHHWVTSMQYRAHFATEPTICSTTLAAMRSMANGKAGEVCPASNKSSKSHVAFGRVLLLCGGFRFLLLCIGFATWHDAKTKITT